MTPQTLQIDPQIGALFAKLSRIKPHSIEPGRVNEALNVLGQIPAFLRSLLVADGTVTMALEAFFSETITIKMLRQGQLSSPQSIPTLNLKAGESCLFREVILLGETTGRLYTHATSIVRKDVIDTELFDHLLDEHEGIGVVLRNVAKGSFREVIDVSRLNSGLEACVERTYRVSLNSIPTILITEEFAVSTFA